MGCMAFRTLPNRLSADPVKPAVHLTAIHCLLPTGKSANLWPPRSGPFTRPPIATRLKPLWMILKRVNGAENSRSSARCGGGNGSRGFLSAYPPEVRKMIYTTNAIESLHMQLRKIVKNRGHFPNDQAAKKLRFLALRNIEKNWIAYRKLECLKIKTALIHFALKHPLLLRANLAAMAELRAWRVQPAGGGRKESESIMIAQGIQGRRSATGGTRIGRKAMCFTERLFILISWRNWHYNLVIECLIWPAATVRWRGR